MNRYANRLRAAREPYVVFVSGGEASHWAATLAAERYGPEKLRYVFTDPLTEDADNYRLILESAKRTFGVEDGALYERARDVVRCLPSVTSYESLKIRKTLLPAAARYGMAAIPQLTWIHTTYNWYRQPGPHSIVDVWFNERMLGNQQKDNCSRYLKRLPARRWIDDHYEPGEVTVMLGLDDTEPHRHDRVWGNWRPHPVELPLTWAEVPAQIRRSKKIRLDRLEQEHGIERPRLYRRGNSHNNCSSFCVRQGVGDHRRLMHTRPEVFDFFVQIEDDFQRYIWAHRAAQHHNGIFGTDMRPEDYIERYREEGRELGRMPYTFAREFSLEAILDHVGLTEDEVERRRVEYTKEGGTTGHKTAWCRKDTGERLPTAAPISLREIRRREQRGLPLGDDRLGCGGCFLNHDEEAP